MPKIRLWMLMVAVVLIAPPLAAFSYFVRKGLINIGPSHTAIHSMADRLITSIETWESNHGRYPESLAEAGLSSPTWYDGGFQYEITLDGYILWIGHANGTKVCHRFFRGKAGDSGWRCMD